MPVDYVRAFNYGYSGGNQGSNQTHYFYQPGAIPAPVGIASDFGVITALYANFYMPNAAYQVPGANGALIDMSGKVFELYLDQGDNNAAFVTRYPCPASSQWQTVNLLALIQGVAGYKLNKYQRLGIYHGNQGYGLITSGEFFFLNGDAAEQKNDISA